MPTTATNASANTGTRRLDKRTHDQIRQMHCSLSPLAAPDGSAKFGLGQSSVLAAVYGPVAVRLAKEQLEGALVDVEVKPLAGGGEPRDRHHERILQPLLARLIQVSLYPRTCIRVILQPTSTDGPLLATLINAALLALLDAGIPMTGMASALTIAIAPGPSKAEGEPRPAAPRLLLLLDPTQAEVEAMRASGRPCSLHTICMGAGSSDSTSSSSEGADILAIDSMGSFTATQHLQCVDIARAACTQMVRFFQAALSRKVAREGVDGPVPPSILSG